MTFDINNFFLKDNGEITLHCKVLRSHFKFQNIKAIMKKLSEISVNPWFPVFVKNFNNYVKIVHFIMISLAAKK